jgi:hypothetical protein
MFVSASAVYSSFLFFFLCDKKRNPEGKEGIKLKETASS